MKGTPHAKKVRLLQLTSAVVSSNGTSNTGYPTFTFPETAMPGQYHCEICDKTVTGPEPYAAHLSGAPHAKKVANLKLQKQLLSQSVDTVDSPIVSPSPLKNDLLLSSSFNMCKLCNVPLSGLIPAKQHYEGSSHKKKERQQLLLKQLRAEKGDSPINEDSESEESDNINETITDAQTTEEELINELSDVIICEVDTDPLDVIKNLKWD